MSANLSSFSRRLAKLEQQLADAVRSEELSRGTCICRKHTVVYDDKLEEFESEKNKPCPTHGVRQMGSILRIEFIGRPSDRAKATATIAGGAIGYASRQLYYVENESKKNQ